MINPMMLDCPGCSSFFYENEFLASPNKHIQLLPYRKLDDEQKQSDLLRSIISLLNAGGGSIYMPVNQMTGKITWGNRMSNSEMNQYRNLIQNLAAKINPSLQVTVNFVPVLSILKKFHASFITRIIVPEGLSPILYTGTFKGIVNCFVRNKEGKIDKVSDQRLELAPQKMPKQDHQCRPGMPLFELELPVLILKGSMDMQNQTANKVKALTKVQQIEKQTKIKCEGYRQFFIIQQIILEKFQKVQEGSSEIIYQHKEKSLQLKNEEKHVERKQVIQKKEESDYSDQQIQREPQKIPKARKKIPATFNYILNILIPGQKIKELLRVISQYIFIKQLKYKYYQKSLLMFFIDKSEGVKLKEFITVHKVWLQKFLEVKGLNCGEFSNSIQVHFVQGKSKENLQHLLREKFTKIKIRQHRGQTVKIIVYQPRETIKLLIWLSHQRKIIKKEIGNHRRLVFSLPNCQ